MKWILLSVIGICAVFDLRNRTIPAFWIWSCVGVLSVYRLFLLAVGRCCIEDAVLCILPGILILLFAYGGKQMGDGDGWLIIACGLCLEQGELLQGLLYAFLAAGICGVGYMLCRKHEGDRKIPFVPFLFLGVIIVLVGERI